MRFSASPGEHPPEKHQGAGIHQHKVRGGDGVAIGLRFHQVDGQSGARRREDQAALDRLLCRQIEVVGEEIYPQDLPRPAPLWLFSGMVRTHVRAGLPDSKPMVIRRLRQSRAELAHRVP